MRGGLIHDKYSHPLPGGMAFDAMPRRMGRDSDDPVGTLKEMLRTALSSGDHEAACSLIDKIAAGGSAEDDQEEMEAARQKDREDRARAEDSAIHRRVAAGRARMASDANTGLATKFPAISRIGRG